MIIQITPENFHAELIEASMVKTIAVYFYADALPECQPVTLELEALIGPSNPNLTLAKVDVSNPQLQSLALQLGLQALPALVLFKEGRPVDAIMGSEQLAGVRQFLASYLPKEEDLLLEQARNAFIASDIQAAYDTLKQGHQIAPTRTDITLLLIDCCLHLQKLTQAKELLALIPMVAQDTDYHRLIAALELATQAADSPEIQSLEAKLQQDADNGMLKQELAIQYSQAGRKEEALELLLGVLKVDLNFGDAKKIYLDILATMGGDAVASRYRRHLYTLLY
jgi:putative thioredoxin